MATARDYPGAALVSYGFRPFFLAAALFAVGVLPVWMMIWRGDMALSGSFTQVDDWTGRMPPRGWPLVRPVVALGARDGRQRRHRHAAGARRRRFLVTLTGGRIIPSLTRNWLAQRGAARMPVPLGRFDGACLVAGGTALLAWSLRPEGAVVAALLLMLHAAYLFVPLGLAATSLAAVAEAAPAAGLHLLWGMTVTVMTRATLGHTGRSLAGWWLTAAFSLVLMAALVQALASGARVGPVDGIGAAAALWTLGFAIFAVRVGPWLVSPRVARRWPNPRPTVGDG